MVRANISLARGIIPLAFCLTATDLIRLVDLAGVFDTISTIPETGALVRTSTWITVAWAWVSWVDWFTCCWGRVPMTIGLWITGLISLQSCACVMSTLRIWCHPETFGIRFTWILPLFSLACILRTIRSIPEAITVVTTWCLVTVWAWKRLCIWSEIVLSVGRQSSGVINGCHWIILSVSTCVRTKRFDFRIEDVGSMSPVGYSVINHKLNYDRFASSCTVSDVFS